MEEEPWTDVDDGGAFVVWWRRRLATDSDMADGRLSLRVLISNGDNEWALKRRLEWVYGVFGG